LSTASAERALDSFRATLAALASRDGVWFDSRPDREGASSLKRHVGDEHQHVDRYRDRTDESMASRASFHTGNGVGG
jgi:hypothetical protein